MKKTILLCFTLGCCISAFSQERAKYQFSIGAGYGAHSTDNALLVWSLEPIYRFSDKVSMAFKYENFFYDTEQLNFTIKTSGHSFSLNSKYYLFKDNRLYLGAGIGIIKYKFKDLGYDEPFKDSKWCFYPTLGIDFRKFNFNIDYNFSSNSGFVAASDHFTFSGNYLSLKFNFFLLDDKEPKPTFY